MYTQDNFERNWAQGDLCRKGFTYVSTNENHWRGLGCLCYNCGKFTTDELGDQDWTCPRCGFEHRNPDL